MPPWRRDSTKPASRKLGAVQFDEDRHSRSQVSFYFDIDRNIVWKTAAEELPPLLFLLDTLMPEE